MTIKGDVQQVPLGALITLYRIDLTAFDLDTILLTPGTTGTSAISFGGETYAPHPIKAEGFAETTTGSLPRPTLAVANIDNSFTALVEQNDDLHGAPVTRVRTYARYLDSGVSPDPDAIFPPDVYEIARKTKHDDESIEWQLAAAADQEGVDLPGRRIIRDFCDHTTRRWNGATFDYTRVTCPYVGAPKDQAGQPCAPAAEVFSKRLTTCCQARFGNAALPTRAFPGVSRFRVR